MPDPTADLLVSSAGLPLPMADRAPALHELATEAPNPRSANLDRLPTRRLLALINEEDRSVPGIVGRCLPEIARTVEAIAARLENENGGGGRLFYVGAGSSGRLGCLDAAEMPPTYGVAPGRVQGIIAGGEAALRRSIEGAEDDGAAGRADLRARGLMARDAVVGLSASGRARYVQEALKEARRIGAFTACVTANANSPLVAGAEVSIVAETGPEVVAGSTRMKAGTAQKLILNMISTALMVKLGRVQGNRMVDLQPRCEKLRERARNLVAGAVGVSREEAERALVKAHGSVRAAITALRSSSRARTPSA